MTHTATATYPYRVTELFSLPQGRVGVSRWSAEDPDHVEHQLRTRYGSAGDEFEPRRRLHQVPAGQLVVDRWDGTDWITVDPAKDPQWRKARQRSRRPGWLRLLIGPAETAARAPHAKTVSSSDASRKDTQ